ncbi:uncharacterized protein LOC122665492 [Telopea speciosissima]|uniref:uncharacterized protein LOC122665492 n=1 Tax=Telopea speciosissima TaxID=54955 RepID=UPI001CC41760|nr:uncharacterized protein LOC122665492 [Telopea speciosissima]
MTALFDKIMSIRLPKEFKMLTLEYYNGTTNPVQHLEGFNSLMAFCGALGPIMCRAFPTFLWKAARTWFNRLEPKSIKAFRKLSSTFLTAFASSWSFKKTPVSMTTVKQRTDESLRSYLTMFNQVKLEVEDLDPAVEFTALLSGINDKDLNWELYKKQLDNLTELRACLEEYMNTLETLDAKFKT